MARRAKSEARRQQAGSVLVTGGLGLLGSWVVNHLAAEGRTVIVLDCPGAAIGGAVHIDYLDPFKDQLRFYSGDPTDIRAVFQVFAENRNAIEGVIHVARVADDQPAYDTVVAAVMGLANVLEVARLNPVEKIVARSSCAVYGDQKGVLNEMVPPHPIDLYGATMAAAEMVGLQFAQEANMLLRIVRTNQVYGPGMVPRPGDVFSPLAGEPVIELASGWDDKRDLTYVKDAAKGIVMAYEARKTDHHVFNISGGVLYSMEDIVEAVKGRCAGQVKVKIGSGVSSARFTRGPLDLTRARDVLGYQPDYNLERGLDDYAQWLKTRSAVPVEAATP